VPITIDDAERPLIAVSFVGTWTDDEFRSYLREMTDRVVLPRTPTVTLLDAGLTLAVTARQRQMQAEWLREHRDVLRAFSLGTAFVIRSPVVRGVLTAILWVQPLEAPHVVVATRDEGLDWCRSRIAARRASS